jgi:hypothetical protein
MKKALLWGAALCAMLVCMGCPTDDDGKEKEPEFEGKILKVTGIPADKIVIAAALIEDLETGAPDVSGFNVLDGTTGTFKLYEATPLWVPDTTKPWKDSGSYNLILATSMSQTDPQYFYTAGKEVLEFNIDAFRAAVEADIAAYIASMMQGQVPTGGISELISQPQDPQKVAAYIQSTITALGTSAIKQNMTQYAFSAKTTTIGWDQFKLVDQLALATEGQAIMQAQETQAQIQAVITELLTAMAAQLAQMQQGG